MTVTSSLITDNILTMRQAARGSVDPMVRQRRGVMPGGRS